MFTATGVNESEKATFQTLVDDALALVGSEGIGQDIIDMMVNQYQFSQLLAPENSNNNAGISGTITYQWGLTGDANAYQSELDFLANIRSYVTLESLKAVVETLSCFAQSLCAGRHGIRARACRAAECGA